MTVTKDHQMDEITGILSGCEYRRKKLKMKHPSPFTYKNSFDSFHEKGSPKMIKRLLSMGMIPVFHRKTQKRRFAVPLLQRFRPFFESASIFSYKIYFFNELRSLSNVRNREM